MNPDKQHDEAADHHDDEGDRHHRSAWAWSADGDKERAALDDRDAQIDRDAAAVDRDRARLERDRDASGLRERSNPSLPGS